MKRIGFIIIIFVFFFCFRLSLAEVAQFAVQQNVAVYEHQDARVHGHVRAGRAAGEELQRQVRVAHRVAQKRLRQHEETVRHDEGRPQPGRQELRHCHAARVPAKVIFLYSAVVIHIQVKI